VAWVVLAAYTVALPAAAADTYPNFDIYRTQEPFGIKTLAKSAGLDTSPSPSPDGRRIAFVSSRRGAPDVYVMNANGTNPKRVTTSPFDNESVAWNDAGKTKIAWAPNGRRIAFDVQNASASPDCAKDCVVWSVYVANANGSGLRQLATQARSPAWSHDSRLIAFESDVTPFGESESVRIVRTDGASVATVAGFNTDPSVAPAWSPRRQELLYQANHAIYVLRSKAAAGHRLTPGSNPTWSPSGGAFAFIRRGVVFRMARAGGSLKRLSPLNRGAYLPVWSPDGREIAYLEGPKTGPVFSLTTTDASKVTLGDTVVLSGTIDGGPVWARQSNAILYAYSR